MRIRKFECNDKNKLWFMKRNFHYIFNQTGNNGEYEAIFILKYRYNLSTSMYDYVTSIELPQVFT